MTYVGATHALSLSLSRSALMYVCDAELASQ